MIKTCVFPVAGLGTRFLPITKSVPKEMLPIGSSPLIELAIKEAKKSNINHLVLITNKEKIAIRDYLSRNAKLDSFLLQKNKADLLSDHNEIIKTSKFNFVYQDQMLGLGNAIFLSKDYIYDQAFFVSLPDDLCFNAEDTVTKQMISLHEKFPEKCIVALEEVPDDDIHKYGIIDGKLISDGNVYQISSMIEKPSLSNAPSKLAIIGRYILTNEIFDVIKKIKPDHNGEIQITDALKVLAAQGKVIGLKFAGRRYDCGSVQGYIEANLNYNQFL